MPALPLNEVVQQAQDALNGGNYQLAVETCQHLLDQFPDYATAHRLLGEAYLEQRAASEAERAFAETLRRDPQSLPAYVGLGLIADERKDAQSALAYFQAAWEIAPQRGDLRDRVVRLAQQNYGPDGRLQLTRAGLGSLHYLAGRWGRAVHEYAAVLVEYPSRVDVRLRLAEALWQRGEDERAEAACRAVLEQAPSATVALLILADIERRRGHEAEAASWRDRARAADPDGARATELIVPGIGADAERADFLLPSEMPLLEERAEPRPDSERRRVAQAPDFSAPAPSSRPTGTAEAVEPPPPLLSNEEIEAARPTETSTAGYTGLLRSLEGEGIEPFLFESNDVGPMPAPSTPSTPSMPSMPSMMPPRPASQPTPPPQQAAAPPTPVPAAPTPPPAQTPPAPELPEDDNLESLFAISSDQEIEAARPPDEQPHGYTTLLRSLEDSGLSPFDVAGAPEPEPAAESPTLPPAQELISEQPSPVATPESPTEFSSQSTIEPEPVPEAVAQPEETTAEPAETAAEAAEAGAEATPISTDWDRIDEEIRNAIPGEMPHGYTDELKSIDASGVEPFSFDDEVIPFFQRSHGRGAAPPPELEATSAAASGEASAADVEADESAMGAAAEPAALDEELRPFSIDDIPGAAELSEDVSDLEGLEDLGDIETDEITAESLSQAMAAETASDAGAGSEMDMNFEVDLIDLNADDLATLEGAHAPAEAEIAAESQETPLEEEDENALLAELDAAHEQMMASWESPAPAPIADQAEAQGQASEEPEFEPTAETEPEASPTMEAEPAQPEEPVVEADSEETPFERLGIDEDLFERAREGKADLLASGRIADEISLEPEPEPEPEPEFESPPVAEPEPEPADQEATPEPWAAEEEDVVLSVAPEAGAPQPEPVSLEELREAVQREPEEVTPRLALADALGHSGQPGAALEEYRWLQRKLTGTEASGERAAQVGQMLFGLKRLAETDAEVAPAAHRLLGAIYRRQGDVQRASRHYSLSLEQSRLAAAKEARR